MNIIFPDDWHCHLRDDPFLSVTVPVAAKNFRRVVVMPNLASPITTVSKAALYHQRIMAHVPQGTDFTPLMTLYLTDNTDIQSIQEAKKSGIIIGCKLYPSGATTNSDYGVTKIERLYPVFGEMEKQQLPLLIHGEVIDKEIDIFDREKIFIDRHLMPLIQEFPDLKIVFEHITTRDAVQFVESTSNNIGATITPHHLLLNRNDMLVGKIQPHLYCLPILKRRIHQEALIHAAVSGSPKFFIGTDSAPHAKSQKESSCGCAGIFNHPNAISVYAQVFENKNSLDKLEGFISIHGAKFYGLPLNQDKISLVKNSWQMPQTFPFGEEVVIPFMAGSHQSWQVGGTHGTQY